MPEIHVLHGFLPAAGRMTDIPEGSHIMRFKVLKRRKFDLSSGLQITATVIEKADPRLLPYEVLRK